MPFNSAFVFKFQGKPIQANKKRKKYKKTLRCLTKHIINDTIEEEKEIERARADMTMAAAASTATGTN